MKKNGLAITSIGLLIFSVNVQAITLDEAKSTYTWDTFQGDASHQGYIPLYFSITGAETPIPRRLYLNGLPETHQVSIYNGGVADVDGLFYYAPKLNQVSISDGHIWVTNRGYRVPHQIWQHSQSSFLTGSFGGWDYGSELGFNVDAVSPTYWTGKLCPISQSQPVFDNSRLYINTNFFVSDHETLCGWDQGTDGLSLRSSYLRNHAYATLKDSDGTSKTVLYFPEQQSIDANQYDEFLAPVIFDGLIYSMGGGETDAVVESGVYSFKDTSLNSISSSIENQWPTVNDDKGYYPVASNDLWSPAVTTNYVITFTAKDNASIATGGTGTLTVIDRMTGNNAFTIDFDKYMPTDVSRYFHLNMAPIISGDDTVLVVNNNHLIKFSLVGRNINTAVEDGFYGQPATDESTVYTASKGGTTCSSSTTYCISARSMLNLLPLSDGNGDRWVWNAPAGEMILPTMVVSNSHLFVSTIDGSNSFNTYALATSSSIVNASRTNATYTGIGGNLSFAYDTLYIAQSPVDVQHSSSLAEEDTVRPSSGAKVDPIDSDKSYVIAIPFTIDPNISADMGVSVLTSASTVVSGASIDYVITVANAGVMNANWATLIGSIPYGLTLITLPDGCSVSERVLSCSVGAVSSGGETTLKLTGIPNVVGKLDFSFFVDSEHLDTISSNNNTTVSIDGQPAPSTTYDVVVSVSDSIQLSSGLETSLSVTISNNNHGIVRDLLVTGNIPGEIEVISVSSTFINTSCDAAARTCVIGELPVGESAVVNFNIRGGALGTYIMSFDALAANSSSVDADLTNNSVASTVEVRSALLPGIGTGKKSGGGAFDFLLLFILSGLFYQKSRYNKKL